MALWRFRDQVSRYVEQTVALVLAWQCPGRRLALAGLAGLPSGWVRHLLVSVKVPTMMCVVVASADDSFARTVGCSPEVAGAQRDGRVRTLVGHDRANIP